MLKYVHKMCLFGMIIIVVVGCAAQQQGEEEPKARIKPNRIYEECIEVLPKQIIEASFSSSKAVHFNIHYHQGEEVIYPVSEENIASWSGSIVVHEPEDPSEETVQYCLMWENPYDVYVSLDYEYTIRDE